MQLTIDDYWMGRDSKYRHELTEQIQVNAAETVRRLNLLRLAYEEDTSLPAPVALNGDVLASGWRPPAVNDVTSNAGKLSTHLTGEGGDMPDPQRTFARWCCDHPGILVKIGLWIEHPGWTWSPRGNHWLHAQTKPPRSGKRVYIPSEAPARDPSFKVNLEAV